MKPFWECLVGLDIQRSIWIEQDELGTPLDITIKRNRYQVMIPKRINKKVILRMRGIGKTRGAATGDVYLHVWLNKGDDILRDYWISESDARTGTSRRLNVGERRPRVFIPEGCRDGVIRYSGLGRKQDFNWRKPFLKRKNGNYYLRVHVYPDTIIPRYGSFEHLSTRDMYLEGWVYRMYDQVLEKIGQSAFLSEPIRVDSIINLFNRRGWRGIFRALVEHLNLEYLNIKTEKSDTLAVPGKCLSLMTVYENNRGSRRYIIQIHPKYLDHPFATARYWPMNSAMWSIQRRSRIDPSG